MGEIPMQNYRNTAVLGAFGLARHMPMARDWESGPQGALIPDETDKEDRIAVVYDRGDTPPEITVSMTSNNVQTVRANGVAVAVVACSDGPQLTKDDILLVERFVRRN